MKKKKYSAVEIYNLLYKNKYSVNDVFEKQDVITDNKSKTFDTDSEVLLSDDNLYNYTKKFVKEQVDAPIKFDFKGNKNLYYSKSETNEINTKEKERFMNWLGNSENNINNKYNKISETLSDTVSGYKTKLRPQNLIPSSRAIDISDTVFMKENNMVTTEDETTTLGNSSFVSSFTSSPVIVDNIFRKDGKNTDINEMHADDIFYDEDTVKVFKVDSPRMDKGFPTNESGFLFLYNRRRKTRLSKFYLHNGGRLTDKPSTHYHGKTYWRIPEYPEIGDATLFDSVKPYNLDYSLLYLDGMDVFYNRFRNNISRVTDLFLNNTYRNRDVIYPNGKPSYNKDGNEEFLSPEHNWGYDFPNYMINKSWNGDNYKFLTFEHYQRETNDFDNTFEDFRLLTRNSRYEEMYEAEIRNKSNNDFSQIKEMFSNPSMRNNIMDITNTSSIVIEDPDTVMQVFVTPTRTYIRSNADTNTIYRHHALKNNEYLFPKEGVLSDVVWDIIPKYSKNGQYYPYTLDRNVEDVSWTNDALKNKFTGYDFSQPTTFDNFPKLLPPVIEFIKNSEELGIDYNPNIKPNYVHFNGKPRPLFMNMYTVNKTKKVDSQILTDFPFLSETSDVVPFIPSNYFIPEGLIYTEFGFFRDSITDDNTLRNNIKKYNNYFKITNENKLHTVEQRLIPSGNSLFTARGNIVRNFNTKEYIDDIHGENDIQSFYLHYTNTNGYEIDFIKGNIIQNSKNETSYIYKNGKYELVKPNYYLNGTGDLTYRVPWTQFASPLKEKASDFVSSNYGKNLNKLQPFLFNDGETYVSSNDTSNTYLNKMGVKTIIPTGDALYYTYEDIIPSNEIENYIQLPDISKYPNPYNGYNIEGEYLSNYLKLAFKGMSKSNELDENGFPKTYVGINTNYKYPMDKDNIINLNTLSKMILRKRVPKEMPSLTADEISNVIGNTPAEKTKNWSFVSFMEKMKKGYPYSTEVSNKLNKKYDMKWNEWTALFYPDSNRNNRPSNIYEGTHMNDLNGGMFRHTINKEFIKKIVDQQLPNLKNYSLRNDSYYTVSDIIDLTSDFYSNSDNFVNRFVRNKFGSENGFYRYSLPYDIQNKIGNNNKSDIDIFSEYYTHDIDILDLNDSNILNIDFSQAISTESKCEVVKINGSGLNEKVKGKYNLIRRSHPRYLNTSYDRTDSKIKYILDTNYTIGDINIPMLIPGKIANSSVSGFIYNSGANSNSNRYYYNTVYNNNAFLLKEDTFSSFLKQEFNLDVQGETKENFISKMESKLKNKPINSLNVTRYTFEPYEIIIDAYMIYYSEKDTKIRMIKMPDNKFYINKLESLDTSGRNRLAKFNLSDGHILNVNIKTSDRLAIVSIDTSPGNERNSFNGYVIIKKLYWR